MATKTADQMQEELTRTRCWLAGNEQSLAKLKQTMRNLFARNAEGRELIEMAAGQRITAEELFAECLDDIERAVVQITHQRNRCWVLTEALAGRRPRV